MLPTPKLAIHGGSPVRKNLLSYGHQCLDQRDEKAVLRVLRSDFLTQGPAVSNFEESFANHLGRRFGVAFTNGTAALHGAYAALGLGPGDELLTSSMTFAATANAALFLGAGVGFADVDPNTGLVDPADLTRKIRPKTKVLTVIHYAGMLCPMEEIVALAKRRGLVLIEDACHALGAEGYGKRAGTFGDMAVFSFHPVKPITSGEGGMVVTDSPRLARRLRRFRTHGIEKSASLIRRYGPWYSEMRELGYNYRLSDLHAALGASQLKKANEFLRRRRRIAREYDGFFASFDGIRIPPVPAGTRSAYHLYPILIEPRRFRGGRRGVFEALRGEGIGVQVHYIPVNAHPYYKKRGHRPSDTPGAQKFYRGVMSIPLFPGMTTRDIADLKTAIEKVHAALRI